MKRPARLDFSILEAERNAQVDQFYAPSNVRPPFFRCCKRKLEPPTMPYDLHKRAVKEVVCDARGYIDILIKNPDTTSFDQLTSDVSLIIVTYLENAISEVHRLAAIGTFSCDSCIQWLKEVKRSITTPTQPYQTWANFRKTIPDFS